MGTSEMSSSLHFARKLVRVLEADRDHYRQEVIGWRSHGHRPHYCEHGTDKWTDYDNICGPCENGETLEDPLYLRRLAIDTANEFWQQVRELNGRWHALFDVLPSAQHDAMNDIYTAALDALTDSYRLDRTYK